MSCRYLLDASAIYPLLLRLREEFLRFVDKFAILDLTIYEVGNVIWKEFRRGRIRDLATVLRLFEEVFSAIHVLRPEIRLSKVVELATNENLTFYDAAYLHTARIYGMKLVTEDRDLLRFPESINVDQLLQELQRLEL